MKIRFFWDFYGPHAERTARHFQQHLGEFLLKNKHSLPTGIQQSGEGHWSAYCDPPDVPQAMQAQPQGTEAREAIADQIGRALRPQRVEQN